MSDHRADQAFHKSIHTLDFAGGSTRTETDNLGAKQIPAGAYWGLNVGRALATHANIADLVVASGLLTREQVTEMLSPGHLTALTESGPREKPGKPVESSGARE